MLVPSKKPGLLSRLTFSWIYPYIKLARKTTITADDIQGYYLERDFEPRQLTARLEGFLNLYQCKRVLYSFWSFLAPYYVVTAIVEMMSIWVISFRIGLLTDATKYYQIAFEQRGITRPDQIKLLVKALVIFFVSLAPPLLEGYAYTNVFDLSIKLRMALNGVIINRVFDTRLGSLCHYIKSGRLINLLSNDAQLLQDCAVYVSTMFIMPLSLYEGITGMLKSGVLRECLYAVPVIILYVVIQAIFALALTRTMRRVNAAGDLRIRLTTDLLCNLQAIKQLSLESLIVERIKLIREQEKSAVRLLLILQNGAQCFHSLLLPISQSVAILARLYTSSTSLASAEIIAIRELLSIIVDKVVGYVPELVIAFPSLNTSLARLTHFLNLPQAFEPEYEVDKLIVENAQFALPTKSSAVVPSRLTKLLGMPYCKPDSATILTPSYSLTLSQGMRCLVVGPNGSGKSVLLEGMCGVLECVEGRVMTPKDLSYCPQIPWITSGSVKDNILMGRVYESSRYMACIRQCDIQDIAAVMDCGERGTKLSGGQRQRVALARAAYGVPQFCILDDPFSALDSNTARTVLKRLFERNSGLMGKSIVIISSSNPELIANSCDIDCQLNVSRDKVIPDFTRSYGIMTDEFVDKDEKDNEKDVVKFQDEERDVKHVYKLRKVLSAYYTFSGGIIALLAVLISFMGEQYLKRRQAGTLSKIVGSGSSSEAARNYLIFTVGMAVTKLLYCAIYTICHALSASKLHNKAIDYLSRTMPKLTSGRILSYLSRDMRLVDTELCTATLAIMVLFSASATAVVLGVFDAPKLLPFILILWVAGVLLHYAYISAWRQARVEISRQNATMISRLRECLDGMPVAANVNGFSFFLTNRTFKDSASLGRANHYLSIVRRWTTIRFELLQVSCRLMVDLACLTFKISPAVKVVVGEAIISNAGSFEMLSKRTAYSLSALQSYDLILGLITDNPESVEICVDSVPKGGITEKPNKINENSRNDAIEFQNVSMSYNNSKTTVLRNISFKVAQGEKVAVVGRTGAGKTSLFNAMYKLLGDRKGTIKIHGRDIDSMPVSELRRSLIVVTQEPVILFGTLRFNIDPQKEYSDDQVIDALKLCGLTSLKDDLNKSIEEIGLSIALEQLVGLARALIRVTPGSILLLDEVTAKADEVYLKAITDTLLTLNQVTIVAIMHRDYGREHFNRVITMDSGRIMN